MFARGPQPGATPKEDALKLLPGATCKRVEARDHAGLVGYVIYDKNGKAVASAGNAQRAWGKAWARAVDAQKN